MFGKFFDRITAVAENSRLAIDIGDRGGAGGGVDEALVEGDVSGLLEQVVYAQTVRSLGRRRHLQWQLLAVMVELDIRHGPSQFPIFPLPTVERRTPCEDARLEPVPVKTQSLFPAL